MKKTTTMAPVERDEKGRVKGGALNPGGMTAEARQARAALQLWLESNDTAAKGKAAYLKALDDPKTTGIMLEQMRRARADLEQRTRFDSMVWDGVFCP